MVLCKFYAQGRCRFGDKCYFEHTPSNYGGFPTTNRFDAFDGRGTSERSVSQQSVASKGSVDTESIANFITAELQQSFLKIQPALTSFSPAPRGPNIPGLIDISPEELRFAAYACKESPQLQPKFLQVMNSARDEVRQWLQRALNRDPGIFNVLIAATREMRGDLPVTTGHAVNHLLNVIQELGQYASNALPQLSQTTSFSSGFGGTTNLGTTSSTTSVASISTMDSDQTALSSFGGARPPPPFGGQASVSPFGGQPAASAFGGSQSQSVFGGQSTASPFGGSQTTSSGFGGTAVGTQPFGGSSVFGEPSQSSSFGTNQSTTQPAFGAAQTTMLFGKPVSASQSLFGQASSSSPFGSQQPVTGFGGNAVAPAPQTSSIFGGSSGIPQQQQPSVGFFGGQSNALFGKGFASNAVIDPMNYSKIEDLSEDILNEFRVAEFTLGRVPVMPPPLELC